MPQDSTIQASLVCVGLVSSELRVPLLEATDGYKITAVSSSRPGDVIGVLPDVDVVSDPQALATTHPGVDLVVIASPNETHAPLAEAAIHGGRNVVVDKPFTITVEE